MTIFETDMTKTNEKILCEASELGYTLKSSRNQPDATQSNSLLDINS
jgi:hypothetical protein